LTKNSQQNGNKKSNITGTTGYYQFTGLTNGTYSIEVASASPGGIWQTWSGVNNTDYLLVTNNPKKTGLYC